MVTTGAKYLFGITAFALVAAVVYGMSTYGDPISLNSFLGAVTFGYKGGVGDHIGYGVLVGLAAGSAVLGFVASAVRDADPKALAELVAGPDAPEEAAPATDAPSTTNWWPAVLAFGLAIVILGLIGDGKVFVFGWVIVGIAALEWAVRAWSERTTGDEAVNRTLRHRILNPLELPLFALVGIAFFVTALSRLLLSSNEHVATVIFGAVPAAVLIIAVVLNARPEVARTLVGGLLAAGALLVLAGGVVGLARGDHAVEPKHKGEHFKPYVIPSGGATSQGLAPFGEQATIVVRVAS